MKIYLSGPMTGIPDYNHPEFNRIAAELREKGYKVINPVEIVDKADTWEVCMRQDIKALMDCDVVAVVEGWDKSKGAGIEVATAVALGMEIIDAHTLEPIWLDVNVSIDEKEVAGVENSSRSSESCIGG